MHKVIVNASVKVNGKYFNPGDVTEVSEPMLQELQLKGLVAHVEEVKKPRAAKKVEKAQDADFTEVGE